jgi:hypothetical protein
MAGAGEALQEGAALSHGAAALVRLWPRVLGEASLIGFICRPVDVPGVMLGERAVGQNDQEIVDASPPEIADYGHRPTFESMALAPDRHDRRKHHDDG